jgi:hypothetical protein
MVELFTNDTAFEIPLRDLMAILTDPFRFAGIMGHVSLLMGETAPGKMVYFDEFKEVPQKFRVGFVLGTPRGKMLFYTGTLEGPLRSFEKGIMYKGIEDSGKFRFEIIMELDEVNQNKTRLTTSVITEFKLSNLDVLLGHSPDRLLGKHVLEQHLIPYLRWQEVQTKAQGVRLQPVMRKTGNLGPLFDTAVRTIGDRGVGIILIKRGERQGLN